MAALFPTNRKKFAMGGIFSFDSPLMEFLGKAADVMILSILWLLGCLPVLTVGTSTTALYYASMKAIRDEGRVTANFFKSYRMNLKQSITAELILLAVLYIFYIDIQVVLAVEGTWKALAGGLFGSLLFLFLAFVSYLFPLLSRFVYTYKDWFRNTLLMSLLNLPITVVILFFNLTPVFLLLWQPGIFLWMLPFLLFMGPGLIARVNSLLFLHIFRKYLPDHTL